MRPLRCAFPYPITLAGGPDLLCGVALNPSVSDAFSLTTPALIDRACLRETCARHRMRSRDALLRSAPSAASQICAYPMRRMDTDSCGNFRSPCASAERAAGLALHDGDRGRSG
jgi:hypothetical protein